MLKESGFIVLFCFCLGIVTSTSYSGNCDNPTDSCTIYPNGAPYEGFNRPQPSLLLITPFCNEINITMSVFQPAPYINYANYYIAPFIKGETNLNNLQPEYHIFNGTCSSDSPSCFESIIVNNFGHYVISMSPHCF